MSARLRYSFIDGEREKIEAANAVCLDDPNCEVKLPICSCALQGDKKPSHCQQGPLPQTTMPECGYYFECDTSGDLIRKGSCNRCGRCCTLPRKNGDPYGFYDPKGSACKHLIVED